MASWLDNLNLKIPVFPRFSLPLLDELIANRGVKACWYKSIACACRTIGSGQPDRSCTQCLGIGLVFYEPTEIVALVTSRQWQVTKVPAPLGAYDSGTVNISFPRGLIPAEGDKIVVTEDVVVYSNEQLIRGNVAPNNDTLERVLSDEILEIEKVIVTRRVPVDPEQEEGFPYTTKVVTFSPPTVSYEGNKILWSGDPPDEAPNDGESYTIRYKARPAYIIFDFLPAPRIDSRVDHLPRMVRARRIDYMDRQNSGPQPSEE